MFPRELFFQKLGQDFVFYLTLLVNLIRYFAVIKLEATMVENSKPKQAPEASKMQTLPCGCVYKDEGWMLTRVSECNYHHRKRTTKRPYRPKAECVRP
jgi:hypothetical protein